MTVTLNSDTEALARLASELESDEASVLRLSADPAGFLKERGIAVDAQTASHIKDRLAPGKAPIAAHVIHVDVN